MATERIDFEVRFTGADDAARKASKVADSIDEMDKAAREATARSIDFTTKVAGAASAVQSLTDALGQQGRVAGLIGSLAGSAAAGAQLGATFGPHGALVGGIAGALVPAITAAVDWLDRFDRESRDAIAAAGDLASTNEQLADSYNEIVTAIRAASSAQALQSRLAMGLGSSQEQEALVETRRQELERLRAMERGYNTTLMDSGASLDAQAAASRLREQVRPLIRAAEAALAEATEAQRQAALDAVAETEELFDQLVADAQSSGGGGRSGGGARRDAEEESNETLLSLMREITAEIDEQRRAEEELAAVREANRQKDIEAELGELQRREEAAQRELELLEEQKLKLDEADREAQEAAESRIASYQDVTGVVVGGLTDALSAIIAGEKTAEDAFKGLLASFLEFISEQAALKAAYEAAAAIESFATQDYAGGAQHIAAALAYGAVAVAAGAGAAALSQPSASGQDRPADPEEREQGEGRGGDTIINFNSPVVTASTRAELGRDLRSLVHEADMRGL